MKRLIILGALGGALAWLHSIGALDPGLWADTFRREKERIRELKEALAAAKRAAAHAEEELDREVRESFRVNSGPRQT